MTEKHENGNDPRPAAALSPSLRRVMAAVLALLIVASTVAAVFFYVKLDDVEGELDARVAVTRVAEQFTARVNNYDAESVDEYQSSVGQMLSTKFRGEFEKAMVDIVRSVQEAQMDSEGTVLASGVASLDQDSARVLVVADANVKTVVDTRARHFRWEVSLVKVDGQWLVDNFTPVA